MVFTSYYHVAVSYSVFLDISSCFSTGFMTRGLKPLTVFSSAVLLFYPLCLLLLLMCQRVTTCCMEGVRKKHLYSLIYVSD